VEKQFVEKPFWLSCPVYRSCRLGRANCSNFMGYVMRLAGDPQSKSAASRVSDLLYNDPIPTPLDWQLACFVEGCEAPLVVE
jgi:hypothetical protein